VISSNLGCFQRPVGVGCWTLCAAGVIGIAGVPGVAIVKLAEALGECGGGVRCRATRQSRSESAFSGVSYSYRVSS
jgi:hypothetical protein